jgi:tRNA threonylcarbamoyladenosine biosynthesis protein TsaE
MRGFPLADETATVRLGEALAGLARPGIVFALSGPLGAGKTCLARGLIGALRPVEPEEIVSPTFTLVQTYPTAAGTVWHFDLYRLKDPEEATELGLDEALAGGIAIIEWPERLGPGLPRDRVDIALRQAGRGRAATVAGYGRCAAAVAVWHPALPEDG